MSAGSDTNETPRPNATSEDAVPNTQFLHIWEIGVIEISYICEVEAYFRLTFRLTYHIYSLTSYITCFMYDYINFMGELEV